MGHFPRHLLLVVLGSLVRPGLAEVVPLLQPGFFFDYNIATQPVPIPITGLSFSVRWRREGATGPSAVAPYSMVVYASTFITPFTIAMGSGLSFDWQVPFAPGTQWDANGVPGGCQAMYTVVQNSTVTQPSCQNVTFPALLDVEATVPGGPMSQYGFINQCTDLFVRPKSGKPPYTLTVAPALHPPFNITSDGMDPIDWTVSLSWAFPFFLSLQSSDGKLWSNGPLHAGGPGSSDCRAPTSKARATAVGAGLGSAFAAGLLAVLGTLLYLRVRARSAPAPVYAFDTRGGPGSASAAGTSRAGGASGTSGAGARTTYVLHHDGGSAPVTALRLADANEVVELPPRYRQDDARPYTQSIREKPQPPLPPRIRNRADSDTTYTSRSSRTASAFV
ncbi:hypothetical protein GGX14DRAFT_443192 [Mycena pura]|uniref:Uncharacterized protein n=1 Tax=Mycena pura TaxID=153505 RepID=A0AAD6YFS5_9AGAR|nr:hypothetical protein GGX14DRAFT_443192 [Mycena pura]